MFIRRPLASASGSTRSTTPFLTRCRAFTLGGLSMLGLVAGLNLSLNVSGDRALIELHSSAQAQSVTSAEITNYAKSVIAIEKLRNAAYQEIKGRLGTETIPDITCNQPRRFSRLSRPMKTVVVKYCQGSADIVKSNDLTITRFNTITELHQTNPDVKRQIRNKLLELQQP